MVGAMRLATVSVAVVPGSFDPPTLGHLDVIRRAASLYDQLHVLVVHNPGQEAMLPIAQRLRRRVLLPVRRRPAIRRLLQPRDRGGPGVRRHRLPGALFDPG